MFFYVLYPPHRSETPEAQIFLSRFKDRVTLLPLEQATNDRLSELYMMRNDLRYYLNPWSAESWDIDVVISSRIPVLKHFRVHHARPLHSKYHSSRFYIGVEEMPVLPYRDSVPWHETMYPDTVMSYAMVDAMLVCHQWMRSSLKPVLREVFSPAFQKRVLDNLHEVLPVRLQRLNLKSKLYSSGNFKLTFVGRMTSTRNIGQVVDLFRSQFSYPLGKNKQDMEFLFSTNSQSIGSSDVGEMDFIDVQMNNREQFYKFLETADVAVNLSTVEDFSLSTYETLLYGVPLIVFNRPWNLFLGPDYPFRVSSELEAYTLINAFAADYTAQYKRFVEWEKTWWSSYVDGPLNITASEVLIKLCGGFEKDRFEFFEERGGAYRKGMCDLDASGVKKVDLRQWISDNSELKLLPKSKVEPYYSLPLGRLPCITTLRVILHSLGWRDTNDCGILEKD